MNIEMPDVTILYGAHPTESYAGDEENSQRRATVLQKTADALLSANNQVFILFEGQNKSQRDSQQIENYSRAGYSPSISWFAVRTGVAAQFIQIHEAEYLKSIRRDVKEGRNGEYLDIYMLEQLAPLDVLHKTFPGMLVIGSEDMPASGIREQKYIQSQRHSNRFYETIIRGNTQKALESYMKAVLLETEVEEERETRLVSRVQQLVSDGFKAVLQIGAAHTMLEERFVQNSLIVPHGIIDNPLLLQEGVETSDHLLLKYLQRVTKNERQKTLTIDEWKMYMFSRYFGELVFERMRDANPGERFLSTYIRACRLVPIMRQRYGDKQVIGLLEQQFRHVVDDEVELLMKAIN